MMPERCTTAENPLDGEETRWRGWRAMRLWEAAGECIAAEIVYERIYKKEKEV